VGVWAVALGLKPFVCVYSLVGAGIGLVLGIAGTVAALIQKRFAGLGLSLAGGAVNLLALVVALIMTLVSGAVSSGRLFAPLQLAVQNEPAASATLPDWGQVFDPEGDCIIERQGPALVIRVPPTAHDLSAELGLVNAPRVLQEVEGDCVAQVKVCGTIRPLANAIVPGRVSFQSAGLLLWQDMRNYIRLERAALNRDGLVQTYASLEIRKDAWPQAVAPLELLDQDTYLRLERRGNQVLGFVSENAQQWMALEPLHTALPNKVRIGVATVNAAQQPLQVRFEEFKIEKK